MSTTTIESLENWISDLEKRVYGCQKISANQHIIKENPLIDCIVDAISSISCALLGRENVNAMGKRLSELDNYLESIYENSVLPTNAQVQLLLAMKPEIMENYMLLCKVQELQSVLETERLQIIPELMNALNDMNSEYLKVYRASEYLFTNIKDLLSKYNSIITTISKALIKLEATVTAAEIAAMPKKQIDE
ncbi:hypothetical protein KM043_017698 [Ampulex compressa]|nr:hypothetical protein KM043_017698 [Ampulex compressa]